MVDGARHDAAMVVADLVGAERNSQQDRECEAMTDTEVLDERLEGRAS
jgi:hypothetical protein